MFSDAQLQVCRNLRAIQAKNPIVPLLLMLAVTKQESNWDEFAVNTEDPGGSYGIFQLNQQYHPGTQLIAGDPWYDYGYYEMKDRWEQAFQSSNLAELWKDPSSRPYVVEQFAPKAQGSVAWPTGLGTTQYQSALYVLELIS